MPRATLMGIPTVPAGGPKSIPAMAVQVPTPQHPMPRMETAPLVTAVAQRAQEAIATASPATEQAVATMSREIIERIAWEVVPELAEAIIREQLDRLVRERQGG
jgi:hypothetical protein